MKTGIELVAQERQEQIEKHGFDVTQDHYYSQNELVQAAKFALDPVGENPPANWQEWFKTKILQKNPIERATVAAALLVASIDRDIEIAKMLMRELKYDNGIVNKLHPEEYGDEWIHKIAPIAKRFFKNNPKFLTQECIEEICIEEYTRKQVKYGKFTGYRDLDRILDEYFDSGMKL